MKPIFFRHVVEQIRKNPYGHFFRSKAYDLKKRPYGVPGYIYIYIYLCIWAGRGGGGGAREARTLERTYGWLLILQVFSQTIALFFFGALQTFPSWFFLLHKQRVSSRPRHPAPSSLWPIIVGYVLLSGYRLNEKQTWFMLDKPKPRISPQGRNLGS